MGATFSLGPHTESDELAKELQTVSSGGLAWGGQVIGSRWVAPRSFGHQPCRTPPPSPPPPLNHTTVPDTLQHETTPRYTPPQHATPHDFTPHPITPPRRNIYQLAPNYKEYSSRVLAARVTGAVLVEHFTAGTMELVFTDLGIDSQWHRQVLTTRIHCGRQRGAALTIQTAYRGLVARRQKLQAVVKVALRLSAAIRLQGWWRICSAKRIVSLHRAALKVILTYSTAVRTATLYSMLFTV